MKNQKLRLSILPRKIAVCRFDTNSKIPNWIYEQDFFSITKTTDELSIVCYEDIVPKNIKAEKDWVSFKVQGPLNFSLTGVLSSLAGPLADENISIFSISTFDTDYLLVKSENFIRSKNVLSTFCEIV